MMSVKCVSYTVLLQLTYLLDDYGIPANYRTMEGHSVNTYTVFDGEGKERYVKFIWAPKAGRV